MSRCATPFCRRRRPSSTNWPTRCRSRCRTRRSTARRSVPAGSPATASTPARLLPGNTVQLSYTDSQQCAAHDHDRGARRRRLTAAAELAARLQRPTDRRQFFRRHELGGHAAQCGVRHQPALLQSVRHRAASRQCQRHGKHRQFAVGDHDGDFAHRAAARNCRCSPTAARRLPGAITASGSQTTGLAGRIGVNPALVTSPSGLVAYSPTTASGDPTRPNFILNQMTDAALTFSPATGVGSAQAPYSGTLTTI